MECSHLDGKRTNNSPRNLAWETSAANEARKREHGTILSGEMNPQAKFGQLEIFDIRALYAEHLSTRRRDGFNRARKGFRTQMARSYGVHEDTISSIVREKTWKY
jgi:hypothetical protein